MGEFKVGSIFGFEIRIDSSWFAILFLILWSFSFGVFPTRLAGLTTQTYVLMGTIGAFLFFASLLAHELAHSLVARAKGITVEGITLYIFGGMARTRREAEDPTDEFLIAGVGPLSSFIIGGLFGLVWWAGSALGVPATVTVVARYLAFINVILAVFNLLPGFPLDGGRLFRAVVWKVTGDLGKATQVATIGGQWLGYALMAMGVLQLLAGAAIGGLWFIFIGWFLRNAAVSSYRQHLVRALLGDVEARELMTPQPDTVSTALSLQTLVDEHFLRKRHQSFPVMDGDRAVGLITLERVQSVPRTEWPARTVGQTMRGIEGIVVGPRDEMLKAMEVLQESGERRLLVVRDGELAGLISASDVTAWLQQAMALEALR